MLKSSKLVLGLGLLLGASVAFLPSGSYATRMFVFQNNEVRLNVEGILGLEVTRHDAGTGFDYVVETDPQDSSVVTNEYYSGTFLPGTSTTNLGKTTFRVTCNYLSYEENSTVVPGCENGWTVSAESQKPNSNGYAAMTPANNANNYRIKSDASKALSSADANWLVQIGTVTGETFLPTPVTAYTSASSNSFGGAIPANGSAAVVVEGNTFSGSAGSGYTYNGPQLFTATYGFSAGGATADTYTGIIKYTLAIKTNS